MSPNLLEVHNIHKSYGGGSLWGKKHSRHSVLQGVSVHLAEQDCVSLMGRSGEGKSTLVRVLLGLESPDSGQVLLRGTDVHASLAKGDRDMRMRLQVVFQNAFASLNPRLTVSRSIAEPLRNMGLAPHSISTRVNSLLEQVELTGFGGAFPCQLSGGQIQRVCLARALAPRPSLLVLDEAFSGLDMLVQARMVDVLHNLCREHGLTCIMVTHDARLAAAFSQRILILHQGRIAVEAESVSALRLSPHPAAQDLTGAMLFHSHTP